MEVMIFKIGEIMDKKLKIKGWCHQEEGYPFFKPNFIFEYIYNRTHQRFTFGWVDGVQ